MSGLQVVERLSSLMLLRVAGGDSYWSPKHSSALEGVGESSLVSALEE